MSTEDSKKSNKLPWILAGCGCLLALLFVGGILAAIAVPAFTRYIKQSKTAEARANLSMIANAAADHYRTNCEFPPAASPTSDVPASGERVASKFEGKGWDGLSNVPPINESYFAYQTRREGDSFVVTARADFNPGPPVHEASMTVTGDRSDESNCTAEVGPYEVTNELQ